MIKLLKQVFASRQRKLPGTEHPPMTEVEAAAYWARMARQSQQSGGW